MFDAILRELRETSGITRLELAQALDVAQTTVAGWENMQREPSFAMLCSIADYFGVSTDYLLGRDAGEPGQKDAARALSQLRSGLMRGQYPTLHGLRLSERPLQTLIQGLQLAEWAAMYQGGGKDGKKGV